MKRPFCVGLTGSAGSGKSTAARLFATHGAAVVDTDELAHGLTGSRGAAISRIRTAFGDEFIREDGAMDRGRMRGLVFSDPQARHALEAILHPMIRDAAVRQLCQAQSSYVVLVVPLLIEHWDSYRPWVDRVVVVDCDTGQQIQRIVARNGLTLGEAEAILAAQTNQAARMARATDILDNRGGLDSLALGVSGLHALFLRMAEEKKRAGLTNSLP